MADNTNNKDRLKEITDGIEQGIGELFQSDRYMQYLRTMSRFHTYSVNNQMLIFMQKPDATLVAGFNKWRDQFERHVKKGEKGIKIIAPTPFKKKIEEQKLDPLTKAPVLDAEGRVVMEEREIKIPMYKVVSVFDVAQTDGKPLPQLASDLSGNVTQFDFFMEALRRSSPVPLHIETMTATMDGYFDLDRQDIAIRKGMSEVQTVSAAVHEIAHAKLHNREQERLAAAAGDETAPPPTPKDRRTEEVEAESISYAVCQYYGIQTGENSFGYIASWSKDKELPELRASLETINKTASGLISDIDRHFREITKEYDVVLEEFAADCCDYVRANPQHSLLLDSREESIVRIVDDIKSGNGLYVRTDIIMAAQNEGAASPDELYRRLDEIERIYPERETETVHLLDNETYLHIQEADEGYDYTLYDKSLREIDGGLIDDPAISLDDAYIAVMELEQLHPESAETVSLSILDEIAAVRAQDVEDYRREHNMGQPDAPETLAAHPLPEPPEQAYYYPMPDPDFSVADLEACGYMDGDMLPLSQLRALELYDKDLTIYAISDGGEASMVFDASEIENHGGLLAVPYDEWEVARHELAPPEMPVLSERAFLDTPHDAFAIYQLKHGEHLRDYHFEPMSWLESKGLTVQHDNYNLVYTAPLTADGRTPDKMEALWYQFNNEHPADFRGHSLSVSDIVVLKQDGVVSCHYCDSFGYQELPGFYSGKNPLRAAEDAIEQNDNNLDGIINNLPTQAVYRESLAHARDHDELDDYLADRQLNFECRDAIDAAIQESRYDTNLYKLKDAAKQVVDTYGAERVELIMAKIVQGADWDGRYSRQNKDWAKGFAIPQGMKDIYINTHPCLLDGFLDKVREKPSILEKLRQPVAKPEHKKTAPTKGAEMEI